jgi:hypothetical protein
MSVLARSGSCCYPVSDVWLTANGADVPEYCDIDEIRNETTGNQAQPSNALHGAPATNRSAYLTWVLANDPAVTVSGKPGARRSDGANLSRHEHVRMASFIDNGLRIGESENGDNLRGIMKGNEYVTTQEYVGGINHPERYRRIYRTGTSVRGIWFVGYNEG